MQLDEKDKKWPEETGTDTGDMGSATLGGYVNPYEGQIMELYKGISERKPFRYDVNEDVMYQNLRDQYIAGGQMAMMDTMGQAAQLTGGYGNSYAQGVGQQAYQGYLQGLNDQIPDLYNMALQNYIQTGDAMLQEYGMLQDMAADDYGKYQDQMALVQPQVLEMLEKGIRPSDEMIAASGLSKEYIDAMYPEKVAGRGSGYTGETIDDQQFYRDVQNWQIEGKSDKEILQYTETAIQSGIIPASSYQNIEKWLEVTPKGKWWGKDPNDKES